MSGETGLIKIEDIDDSLVHNLKPDEIRLCLFIVNGGMTHHKAALQLGMTKNAATRALSKPEVIKYIDLLKKKLTVNAVDTSLNQLKAIQDVSFSALMNKFEPPDHIRDLPADATADMIKDYYRSHALYTPVDKIHKIYADTTKIINENSPQSEIKTTDDLTFEARVRTKFQERVTRQKRMVEELHKRGIPASRFSEFGITDEMIIEMDKENPKSKGDEDEVFETVETVETTITVRGSAEDISKLSMFDKE